MRRSGFEVVCPYEVGDILIVDGQHKNITEIAVTHYTTSGQISVAYQLDGYTWWQDMPMNPII